PRPGAGEHPGRGLRRGVGRGHDELDGRGDVAEGGGLHGDVRPVQLAPPAPVAAPRVVRVGGHVADGDEDPPRATGWAGVGAGRVAEDDAGRPRAAGGAGVGAGRAVGPGSVHRGRSLGRPGGPPRGRPGGRACLGSAAVRCTAAGRWCVAGRLALPLLRVLDRIAQLLVPPVPGRIGWVTDPDGIGNAYHLFRHAVTTRRDLHHVWLVVDEAAGRRLQEDFAAFGGLARGHRLDVVARHGLAGYLAYLRCRHVFHTHGVYRWVASALRRDCVSLWHGLPIKAIGALNTITPNPHPTYGTLHVATSDFFRYVIATAFRATPDEVL